MRSLIGPDDENERRTAKDIGFPVIREEALSRMVMFLPGEPILAANEDASQRRQALKHRIPADLCIVKVVSYLRF